MKTADTLFSCFSGQYYITNIKREGEDLINRTHFKKALTKHDEEIKQIIDDKIDLSYYQSVVITQNDAGILKAELHDLIKELTELKNKL